MSPLGSWQRGPVTQQIHFLTYTSIMVYNKLL